MNVFNVFFDKSKSDESLKIKTKLFFKSHL